MSHLDPERLALTAAGAELTPTEQEHIDACDDCALELAELEHTVDVARATALLGPLETPPERVWERISAEVRAAAAEAPPTRRERRPRRTSALTKLMFTLAASIAMVLVAVGVWSVVRPVQVVELAAASLDAFPAHPGSAGEAVVVENPDGQLEVRVALDADDFEDGYREVWLIKADASDLVSLGVLQGRDGVFTVPEGIDIHDFVLVDISQEHEDGDPTHSGDSVVRGELQFA
ncbi:anti-sigma factor [Microbacterium sp. SLBN-146]|uniref:anti-sigma factor n=1 Tax=Microbacterium sp. SLBN-146 TaxID=2768457 RepID=UPI00114EC224|nr:anti-sigma factor [Microbacterium sp. SLBN-146]TQJ31832.1 anti-sigma-K factor rskA [Microbacterium sp. SLBN-146]